MEFKQDKSIVITTETPIELEILIKDLENILENFEMLFAQTENYTYKVSLKNKIFLRDWFLSVEGAIALIVLCLSSSLRMKPYDFELINSNVGGIYIHPFTILFHADHAKIIHPIQVSNFFLREQIERIIATSMKGILQRVGEAQEGYEGLALLSYVEEKTKLSPAFIARIINEKTRKVITPKYSPMFK